MKTAFEQEVTKRYAVSFNEPSYNATYTFKRYICTAAFQYGNQTGVHITIDFCNGKKDAQLIDTRYDTTVADFDVWCENWLSGAFDKSYEPKWAEVQY